MGLDINLDILDEISVDLSTFPHAHLELKNKGERFVKKIKFSTHDEAKKALSQINAQWHKTLKERHERKSNI